MPCARCDRPTVWWAIGALFDQVVGFIGATDLRDPARVNSVWAEGCHRSLAIHKDIGLALQSWACAAKLEQAARWLDDFGREVSREGSAAALGLKLQALQMRIVVLEQQKRRHEVEVSAAELLCRVAAIEKAVASGLLKYMRRHESRLRNKVTATQQEVDVARTRVTAAHRAIVKAEVTIHRHQIDQVAESLNRSGTFRRPGSPSGSAPPAAPGQGGSPPRGALHGPPLGGPPGTAARPAPRGTMPFPPPGHGAGAPVPHRGAMPPRPAEAAQRPQPSGRAAARCAAGPGGKGAALAAAAELGRRGDAWGTPPTDLSIPGNAGPGTACGKKGSARAAAGPPGITVAEGVVIGPMHIGRPFSPSGGAVAGRADDSLAPAGRGGGSARQLRDLQQDRMQLVHEAVSIAMHLERLPKDTPEWTEANQRMRQLEAQVLRLSSRIPAPPPPPGSPDLGPLTGILPPQVVGPWGVLTHAPELNSSSSSSQSPTAGGRPRLTALARAVAAEVSSDASDILQEMLKPQDPDLFCTESAASARIRDAPPKYVAPGWAGYELRDYPKVLGLDKGHICCSAPPGGSALCAAGLCGAAAADSGPTSPQSAVADCGASSSSSSGAGPSPFRQSAGRPGPAAGGTGAAGAAAGDAARPVDQAQLGGLAEQLTQQCGPQWVEEEYAPQLLALASVGYHNVPLNLALLHVFQGDLSAVTDFLCEED
eukprot:TRINITY_DN1963_c1_g1_i1.p1 TRINITY_DN1963_c1_g1~~TRINITY_DN1963_c1_g1_i1.p1  ORF type:complete len:736 (+),score=196.79 TRINITY_DN1963_c1_g1_i1:80-2209(+)